VYTLRHKPLQYLRWTSQRKNWQILTLAWWEWNSGIEASSTLQSTPVVSNLGSRLRGGSFAFFLGIARACDKNIHKYFSILYIVYGIIFCHSQNNRITWQKWWPTFSFKVVLSAIMTVLLRLATHEELCDVRMCCVCKLDIWKR